jgi:hypothetical protein
VAAVGHVDSSNPTRKLSGDRQLDGVAKFVLPVDKLLEWVLGLKLVEHKFVKVHPLISDRHAVALEQQSFVASVTANVNSQCTVDTHNAMTRTVMMMLMVSQILAHPTTCRDISE